MFNLPELLRTIAEDYGDRGCEITYDGTKHVTFQGQPVALKRTFENLVDNAVKGLGLTSAQEMVRGVGRALFGVMRATDG